MSNAKQRSMAAQAGRRRILRIGVLLGGKIVEERLIRGHDDVTIGQSSKNTFSIPLETLPRQWTIFGNENEGYVLKFLPKMDGRISDGEIGFVSALTSIFGIQLNAELELRPRGA